MKNLNLQNFGVVEMNAEEMGKVEGGTFPWKKAWDLASKALTVYDLSEAISNINDCHCEESMRDRFIRGGMH